MHVLLLCQPLFSLLQFIAIRSKILNDFAILLTNGPYYVCPNNNPNSLGFSIYVCNFQYNENTNEKWREKKVNFFPVASSLSVVCNMQSTLYVHGL